MTFCKVCGKLLPNVRFDPTEVTICQNCADRMKEDLVQVVRCKDCIYGFCINPSEKEKIYECMKYPIANLRITHKPGWFCADGEK